MIASQPPPRRSLETATLAWSRHRGCSPGEAEADPCQTALEWSPVGWNV